MDLPRPRHSNHLIAPRPHIRRPLDLPRHNAVLPKPGRRVLELLRALRADAVALGHDPGAVAVVAEVEAGALGGLVDGARQHAEHLGRVAAAAEHDEQVRGLLGVAAAVSDGLCAGGGEDPAGAEEERGCC